MGIEHKLIHVILLIIYLFVALKCYSRNKITMFLVSTTVAFFYVFSGVIFFDYFEGFHKVILSNELSWHLTINLLIILVLLIIESKIEDPLTFTVIHLDWGKSVVIFFFIVLFFMILFFVLNGIPALSPNPEQARMKAFFNTKSLYYNFLILSPLCLILLFQVNKMRLFVVALIFFIILSYMTAFRSLIMNIIFISFMLVQIKYKIIKLKNIAFLSIFAGLVFFTLYQITAARTFNANGNQNFALMLLLHRIFIINIDNIIEIISFHRANGYLFGGSIFYDFIPLRLLWTQVSTQFPAMTYAEFITSSLKSHQQELVMTPTLYGIGIANYNSLGIYFSTIGLFFISRINSIMFKKNNATTLYLYNVLLAFPLFSRGFFSVFSLYFIPVLFIFIGVYFFSTKRLKYGSIILW